MQGQLKAEAFEEACRRRSERRNTSAVATYVVGGGRDELQIANLSVEGARLSTSRPLVPGRRIWLKMPMLASHEAVVIWVLGLEAGVEFSDSLHPMVVEAISRSCPTKE